MTNTKAMKKSYEQQLLQKLRKIQTWVIKGVQMELQYNSTTMPLTRHHRLTQCQARVITSEAIGQ